MKRHIIIILFSVLYQITYAQDVLSEFGIYTDQPHDITTDRDYLYLINSRRIHKNKIKKCTAYNYSILNGKIKDSTLNYSVVYHRSGFDSILTYSKGNSISAKTNSILNFNRDSLIRLDSILLLKNKGKKVREESGFCKLIKIYDQTPRVIKATSRCSLFRWKNTYHEMKYNVNGFLISAVREKGRSFFRKKFVWCINYIYDSNGNLIELFTTDENGVKKGGQKFHYEYWE